MEGVCNTVCATIRAQHSQMEGVDAIEFLLLNSLLSTFMEDRLDSGWLHGFFDLLLIFFVVGFFQTVSWVS